ncbi:MAG: hypothetical protein EOP54_11410 [Sphingobacteriales bacterium]|nr:MAG: hypothetical protein EOP54_11410 [Sphingobacteriales bacterium]
MNLKKISLGLAALCLAFGLVLSLSAFKATPTKAHQFSDVYYKYIGTSFNETAYRNSSNWQHIDDPGEAECGGETNICVLRVSSEDLTSTDPDMLVKLDDFFSNQLGTPGSVDTYVNTPANIEAQQN